MRGRLLPQRFQLSHQSFELIAVFESRIGDHRFGYCKRVQFILETTLNFLGGA